MKLTFLGGTMSVGRSAVLVDTGTERVVLDYGAKTGEGPLKFPLPVDGKVDAACLSHAHLDHSGGLALLGNEKGCPVYAQNCTKELSEMLMLDSVKISREEGTALPFTKQDISATMKQFNHVNYREEFEIKSIRATYYDAGHIPGSSMIHLNFNGKSLLYTGDINTSDTRLLRKADQDLPEVNYLIMESTYSDRDHPDRKSQERELVRIINETEASGGVCLVSGFAVGRIQELLLVLDRYGVNCPIYLDGMAKRSTRVINRYRELLREPNGLRRAMEKVTPVTSDKVRKQALKKSCVVLTTSGMLSGGPIVMYLKKLCNDHRSSLVLTGYQVEGTPGRILLESGRYIAGGLDLEVQLSVHKLDFSAHAGRKGLFDFVKRVNPERVFCVHGDHTEAFAEELRGEGFDAVAPMATNRAFVVPT